MTCAAVSVRDLVEVDGLGTALLSEPRKLLSGAVIHESEKRLNLASHPQAYSILLDDVASRYLTYCSTLGISFGSKPLQTGGMEVRDIRRNNLLLLIRRQGGTQAEFARVAGVSPNYINQVLNSWQGRGLGHQVARKIERAVGKSRGWMDTSHPEDWQEAETMADPHQRSTGSGRSARAGVLAAELESLSDVSLDAVASLIESLKRIETPHRPPPGAPKGMNIRK